MIRAECSLASIFPMFSNSSCRSVAIEQTRRSSPRSTAPSISRSTSNARSLGRFPIQRDIRHVHAERARRIDVSALRVAASACVETRSTAGGRRTPADVSRKRGPRAEVRPARRRPQHRPCSFRCRGDSARRCSATSRLHNHRMNARSRPLIARAIRVSIRPTHADSRSDAQPLRRHIQSRRRCAGLRRRRGERSASGAGRLR